MACYWLNSHHTCTISTPPDPSFVQPTKEDEDPDSGDIPSIPVEEMLQKLAIEDPPEDATPTQ